MRAEKITLPAAVPGKNCAAVVGPAGCFDVTTKTTRRNLNLPLSRIVTAVCRAIRVDETEFRSNRRGIRVVAARELVAAMAHSMTRASYPEIAFAMNRPNHSTVIDAKNRWRARVDRASRGDQSAMIVVGREVMDPQALYDQVWQQLERTVAVGGGCQPANLNAGR